MKRVQQCLLFSLAGLVACVSESPKNGPTQVTIDQIDDLERVTVAAQELARRYARDDLLVVFDLDNTLLAMRTPLGSDQWYDWQRVLESANSCDPQLVADRLAAQGALFHVGAMRPTQTDVAEQIRGLQSDGFATMIVTARGHDFRLPTFRELRRNGLNFRDSTIGPVGGIDNSYTPPDAKRPVRFEDGVYMLAGQDKGKMLLALFDRLMLDRPAAVVFVDDKAKNVEAMYQALLSAKITGKLFLYNREPITDFPSAAASADWRALEPALLQIQQVMGVANFHLPERSEAPTDCNR